jgi:hypothetical protein
MFPLVVAAASADALQFGVAVVAFSMRWHDSFAAPQHNAQNLFAIIPIIKLVFFLVTEISWCEGMAQP